MTVATVVLNIASPLSAAEIGQNGEPLVPFDIPAESLDEALFAYTNATGIGVLVEDGLASGRRSTAVAGQLTPKAALALLLSGTGLEFHYTVANAFTLAPAQTALAAPSMSPPPVDDVREEAYFRTVQTAVKQGLCRRAQTLPGQYRIVVQLWIDGSGTVLRSALLGSSGSRDRDDDLSTVLNGLPIGAPPPAGLPQPLTMVILPRLPEMTGDCVSVDHAARAKGWQ